MNNKTLFKLHGWVGLFAFLPLLVICVTGSVLVFKYELENIIRPHMVTVTESERRLELDTLKDSVNQQFKHHEIVGWVLFQDRQRADVVYLMPKGTDDWRHIYLDPFDGGILSSPAKKDDFLSDWLLELHANFLLEDSGLVITTVYSLLLIILGISGLMLYKKFWKSLFKIRWQAKRILLFSDLHKQVGFFSAPIFLVLGITGGYWNIAHLLHEYEHHASGDSFVMQDRLYNDALSIDDLQRRAHHALANFKSTYITFPYEEDMHFTFYGDVSAGNPLSSEYASSVTFHRHTGEHMASYDIRTAPMLNVFLDTFRPLHFGLFAGMPIRVLWCVAGLMPLILSFTGVYMWLLRRSKKRAKQLRLQKRAAAQEVTGEANPLSI
ncbi:MAG: PepSY-associated TM helix domain-containing protein, partial [Bermanella sp.]